MEFYRRVCEEVKDMKKWQKPVFRVRVIYADC